MDGQPSGTNLTRIREVVAPLFLRIPYNKTGGTHHLISLIRPMAAYTTRYGAEFAEPTQIGAYDVTIDDDYTTVVRTRTEASRKAKRADCGTYKTTRREIAQFTLAVVNDTWVWELRETEKFYTNVAPKALLTHLQAGCKGRHALDLLALHNEMKRYYLKVEGFDRVQDSVWNKSSV